jgi:hypothetical protein
VCVLIPGPFFSSLVSFLIIHSLKTKRSKHSFAQSDPAALVLLKRYSVTPRISRTNVFCQLTFTVVKINIIGRLVFFSKRCVGKAQTQCRQRLT